jgi:cell division septation protein DedD
MNDGVRNRSDRQIWITRGHLGALAVTTASVALLTFLVGVQVGRRTAPEVAGTESQSGLLPDAAAHASLELLLREVELAQASVDPTGQPHSALSFPSVLGKGTTAAPTSDEPEVATVSIAPTDGDAPRPPQNRPPIDGWSVQVGSHPTQIAADAELSRLQEDGHEAYRVAALVDGQTWYRVRIGGFASQAKAEKARHRLSERLKVQDLVLAESP